jgi:hypothetical protein
MFTALSGLLSTVALLAPAELPIAGLDGLVVLSGGDGFTAGVSARGLSSPSTPDFKSPTLSMPEVSRNAPVDE